jgi:hypothetical protein
LLGSVIFLGASKFHISRAIQANGEKWIGPLLVVIGIFMLDFFRLPALSGNIMQRFADKVKLGHGWGAFFLGLILALAFCPYSGVLYFGMLMPMVLSQSAGLLLLPDFAIATGLPVILLAYLLAFSIGGIGKTYNKIKYFEVWFRRIVAMLFILTGSYFITVYFL